MPNLAQVRVYPPDHVLRSVAELARDRGEAHRRAAVERLLACRTVRVPKGLRSQLPDVDASARRHPQQDAARRIQEAVNAEAQAREEASRALQGFLSDVSARTHFQDGDATRQLQNLSGFLQGTGFDQSPALAAILRANQASTDAGRQALKDDLSHCW